MKRSDIRKLINDVAAKCGYLIVASEKPRVDQDVNLVDEYMRDMPGDAMLLAQELHASLRRERRLRARVAMLVQLTDEAFNAGDVRPGGKLTFGVAVEQLRLLRGFVSLQATAAKSFDAWRGALSLWRGQVFEAASLYEAKNLYTRFYREEDAEDSIGAAATSAESNKSEGSKAG